MFSICVLQVIQINFEEFDMEIAYDTLTIGDGGEVGDPTAILQVYVQNDIVFTNRPDIILLMSKV
jgi:CUB/sushi domain-containing protein